MITIKVVQVKNKNKLISPLEMINKKGGTIFQQYFRGAPCKEYYICCGPNEPSVIHIWYDEEGTKYRLSTDNLESLKELVNEVKVVEIKGELNITLEQRSGKNGKT